MCRSANALTPILKGGYALVTVTLYWIYLFMTTYVLAQQQPSRD